MPASRSLIALLIGTVVFFALWMIALKPSSSNSQNGKSQGLGAFQSDINSAHHAVATANANQAASAGEKATTSSTGTSASTRPAKPAKSAKSAKATATSSTSRSSSKSSTQAKTKPSHAVTVAPPATPAADLSTIKAALGAHKAVALLFYNPAAADDVAVEREMASVPTHKGQVVKLEIPATEAGNFTAVTQQVPVNLTPTLVLISRRGEASEIVGYSDGFEIDQRVADALASS